MQRRVASSGTVIADPRMLVGWLSRCNPRPPVPIYERASAAWSCTFQARTTLANPLCLACWRVFSILCIAISARRAARLLLAFRIVTLITWWRRNVIPADLDQCCKNMRFKHRLSNITSWTQKFQLPNTSQLAYCTLMRQLTWLSRGHSWGDIINDPCLSKD